MTDSQDFHEALVEDAVALANAIVVAKVKDPEGDAAQRLIDSVISEMVRDLPDGKPEGLALELSRRAVRPAIIVGTIAEMIAVVIRGAQEIGLEVHIDALASPYTALVGLDSGLGFPITDQETIDRNRVEFEAE